MSDAHGPGDETMAAAFDRVDWAATALGPVATWSPTLRRAVRLVRDTDFPASLFWGPAHALVYNAAFIPLIADKHPAGLGAPAAEVFAEAWDFVGPLIGQVFDGPGGRDMQDALVPLRRHGSLQQAYFTFAYSPVRADDGTIEGVLNIATETTRQVLDRRRLILLGRLREALIVSEDTAGLERRAAAVLAEDPEDLPWFALSGIGGRDGARADAPEGTPALELSLGVSGADGSSATLRVAPNPRLSWDETYRPFLSLLAATVGEGFARSRSRDRERRVAADQRLMSEALQRALLTEAPLTGERSRVAVRYLPAAVDAEVGGDWHDAFLTPDGALCLAIGDVTGHDRNAAASMGQIRNLLRGIAMALEEPPDAILTRLDAAMIDLGLDTLVSLILLQLEPAAPGAGAGPRRLRWSNAGHPPPVQVLSSGAARLLEVDPEPLLGFGRDVVRSSHAAELEAGSVVVLYTDGLVERRGHSLDEGFEWLCHTLRGQAGRSPEAIADHVIHALGRVPDDDVALLVLVV